MLACRESYEGGHAKLACGKSPDEDDQERVKYAIEEESGNEQLTLDPIARAQLAKSRVPSLRKTSIYLTGM